MSFNSSKTINTPLALPAVDRTHELELWDAWVFAAGDATRALRAWEEAEPGSESSAAYVVYRAALDREDRAAAVLGECVAERVAAQPEVLVAA